ncbi:hypothetical protein PEL8287_02558 [Roseovarius litorisediminis]|uniref:Uncharacterized protein n=1 Tax=Roseovarius litorisediminis TaxID=1312363 RepID=A0A1Y5SV46_9RHOB|nr:hypothetical protein [Roseovarius litorisediminis]SLN48997.1 hypothetical protein PEL8287_02558 [Roseovarius litorisediminis]
MTPAPTQAYLNTLLLYYEEEIEGEAFFNGLAEWSEHPSQREKLHLLAAVEDHAAKVTLPLIRKHGLIPRCEDDLFRSGRKMARKAAKPWGALLAEFARVFPGYIEDFQRLEAMAPPEDLPRLKLLTEHEVAAVEFLNLEISGEKNSVEPMMNYLRMDIE